MITGTVGDNVDDASANMITDGAGVGVGTNWSLVLMV